MSDSQNSCTTPYSTPVDPNLDQLHILTYLFYRKESLGNEPIGKKSKRLERKRKELELNTIVKVINAIERKKKDWKEKEKN